jgi:hypothetical protein
MIAGAHSESATDESIARRETEMKVRIIRFIDAEYPGYIWTVRVDLTGKYKGAAIALPILTPPNTYEVVPGRFLCTENDMRRYSLDAAGRILERYKVPRAPMKIAEISFLEARAKADVFNLRRKAIVPA